MPRAALPDLAAAERADHQAAGRVFSVVGLDIRAGAVGHAIHHAGEIADDSTEEIAQHLHANVAVGRERRRERPFHEQHVRRRVQPLEPEWRLPLAGADAKRRRENRVDVGILNGQRAAGKVRVHVELEMFRQPSPKIGSETPHHEAVDVLLVLVGEREPAVGMKQQADLQPVAAVRRLERDAFLASHDARLRWRARRRRNRLRRQHGRRDDQQHDGSETAPTRHEPACSGKPGADARSRKMAVKSAEKTGRVHHICWQ